MTATPSQQPSATLAEAIRRAVGLALAATRRRDVMTNDDN